MDLGKTQEKKLDAGYRMVVVVGGSWMDPGNSSLVFLSFFLSFLEAVRLLSLLRQPPRC